MDEHRSALIDIHMALCKQALERNGFHAHVAEDEKQLLEIVNALIQDGDKVSDGGSRTLLESGIIDMLKKRRIDFHSHSDPTLSREESDVLARRAFSDDVFLASANAITMQGEIINVDGHGNRVSAMIFGPKRVILVVGYHKLVRDEAAAIARIQTIAAPANSIRLHKQTPCAYQGTCQDCRSQDRICSSYVKLNYDKEDRIHVILVKRAYGY